jgi:hypothetical protein
MRTPRRLFVQNPDFLCSGDYLCKAASPGRLSTFWAESPFAQIVGVFGDYLGKAGQRRSLPVIHTLSLVVHIRDVVGCGRIREARARSLSRVTGHPTRHPREIAQVAAEARNLPPGFALGAERLRPPLALRAAGGRRRAGSRCVPGPPPGNGPGTRLDGAGAGSGGTSTAHPASTRCPGRRRAGRTVRSTRRLANGQAITAGSETASARASPCVARSWPACVPRRAPETGARGAPIRRMRQRRGGPGARALQASGPSGHAR